ncbi:hypothetical protein FRC10_006262 [Ceratobasidium sp. 414]|nr:hypothetical protein FRC10_006262 [Ceratobasidium sp. 414]
MAERSLGELVELSIFVRRSPMIRHDHLHLVAAEPAITVAPAQLSDLLSPLAPRIRGLDIHSNVYTGSELQAILSCTAKNCVSGTLDLLIIHAKYNPEASTRLLPWDPFRIVDPPANDHMNDLTGAVKFLHLVNVSADWSSNLYRGLTELAIIFTSRVCRITCSEMVQILASCPELRRLSLKGLYAIGWNGPDTEPKTVNLRHLRCLKLQCSRSKRLAPLLQLLRPTGHLLYVRIWVDNEPEFVKQLHSFFKESSKVNVLSVAAKDKTGWFASVREGLNDRLEWLTLEGCDFADPDLAHFVGVEFKLNSLVLWPSLKKLELTRCVVDITSLECLCAGGLMEGIKLTDCQLAAAFDMARSLPFLAPYDRTDFVAFPINAILNWLMATPAGLAILLDPRVNDRMRAMFGAWPAFLASPQSCYVLTTADNRWFGRHASDDMPKFMEASVCKPEKEYYGFRSWDDYFSRQFREGVRPIGCPEDDNIITGAREHTTYRIARDIAYHNTFGSNGNLTHSATCRRLTQWRPSS